MESCTNMEHKPLITFSGDLQVFQSVLPSLQKGIGSEAVEWKRAYGRTTKHVHLHPKFIAFDLELKLNSCTNGDSVSMEPPLLTSLLDQSMLHTFWTDCPDVEVYRSSTKDLIQSWLNNVKNCNVREWLIVLVEIPDNKKTKQLLPRTSVLDKIKNDFAQKQTERCICLADPSKFCYDSKSTESLHSMLHRLRQLLLASYSKTLTKFEENMRAQREKRNESGWNFCHYFLLQEELAFVLEMLEVYDEALVQYDELDALFTQFVLNSHLTDTPQWLLSFQRYGDRWPALNLSPSSSNAILSHIRETIKNSTVSLLNFRNYLFARQAGLLVKQLRVNELAQRSLGFLHNCINELNILDVAFSEDGAISCWVFVSCLEILATICGHGQGSPPSTKGVGSVNKNEDNINNAIQSSNENVNKNRFQHNNSNKNNEPQHNVHHSSMQATDFSVHTASLWDYAREKLYDLGKLGGLLPKSQPKSDHLHAVISLAAGLICVDLPMETASTVTVNGKTELQLINHTTPEAPAETPITKLKNALSSKEQFEQHYLELCELAMGTYKHIGRIRSARKVGLGLASYYMEAEEYMKAIGFLTDALKTFRDDKWNLLVVDVLLKLAQCYHKTNDYDKYVRTCTQLACCKTLNEERRNYYFDEMMSCLSKAENSDHILSSLEETFSINLIKIETPGKIKLDTCPVSVYMDVNSNLPKSVLSSSIQLAILVCDSDHEKHLLSFQTPACTSSQSPGQIDIGGGVSGGKSRHQNLNSNNNSGGGGIVKRSSFENKGGRDKLAKRESINLNPLTCQDEDINITLQDVGHIMLRLDMSQHLDVKQDKSVHGGRLLCHNSHQALRRKDSQMKASDVQLLKTDFSLVAKSNDIILNPGANSLTLHAQVTKPGVYRVGQVSLQIRQFELLSPRLGCRFKFCVEKVGGRIEIGSGNENLNLIAGIEQVITLNLYTGSNNIPPDGMVLHVTRSSFGLLLKAGRDSPLGSEISLVLPEAEPFTYVSVYFIVKADLLPQKDNSVIEHKLITRCPWSNEETKIPIVFIPPFMSSHRLNTVAQRKFIQVMLHGLCNSATFTLSSHQLTVQHQNVQDIPIVPLNPRSQQLTLNNGQTTSYMWEIGTQELLDDENSLRLEFSITFQATDSALLNNSLPTENIKKETNGDEVRYRDGNSCELYRYYICLQRFKTQFEIRSRVEPHKGVENGPRLCRVGNMCSMIIDITKYDNSEQTSLINFEVRADQHMWAICGRTSGVVSMEESNSQQIIIDIMPMSPGFLPLPTVHLSKYIPADQKSGSGNASVPKLDFNARTTPFNSGQVFNQSRGECVHVLPPPQAPAQNMTPASGNVTPSPGQYVAVDAHY